MCQNWRRTDGPLCSVLTCVVGVLMGNTSGAVEPVPRDLKALGVEYRLRELQKPRPNRVHILRVDLSIGAIKPVVVVGEDPDGPGPAETSLTNPLKLARGASVLAFINTNPWDSFPDERGNKNRRWFEGQAVDISGLAASAGKSRSPSQANGASVWVDTDGRLSMGNPPRVAARQEEAKPLSEGMAGFQQMVRQGALITSAGGAVHPRTAIGVDRTGRVIWLVVVDGRQRRFSEGMTVHELGQQMLQLGCWDAMNMDGGGSSVMGLVGEPGPLRVVNSPSDRRRGRRRIRPLPMVLTITAPADEIPPSPDGRDDHGPS